MSLVECVRCAPNSAQSLPPGGDRPLPVQQRGPFPFRQRLGRDVLLLRPERLIHLRVIERFGSVAGSRRIRTLHIHQSRGGRLTFVLGAIRNIHVNVDGAGAQLVGDPRRRHIVRPDRQALESPDLTGCPRVWRCHRPSLAVTSAESWHTCGMSPRTHTQVKQNPDIWRT